MCQLDAVPQHPLVPCGWCCTRQFKRNQRDNVTPEPCLNQLIITNHLHPRAPEIRLGPINRSSFPPGYLRREPTGAPGVESDNSQYGEP